MPSKTPKSSRGLQSTAPWRSHGSWSHPNQIGSFGTEVEARSLLADILRVNGADVAGEMVIVAYFPDGPNPRVPVTVLEGADYVAQFTERV